MSRLSNHPIIITLTIKAGYLRVDYLLPLECSLPFPKNQEFMIYNLLIQDSRQEKKSMMWLPLLLSCLHSINTQTKKRYQFQLKRLKWWSFTLGRIFQAALSINQIFNLYWLSMIKNSLGIAPLCKHLKIGTPAKDTAPKFSYSTKG